MKIPSGRRFNGLVETAPLNDRLSQRCRNVPAHIDRAGRADHNAGAARNGIVGIALRYGSEERGENAYFEDVPDLQLPQEIRTWRTSSSSRLLKKSVRFRNMECRRDFL